MLDSSDHKRGRPGQLESGFTLVEMALAIGIAAFALVPMLGLMSSGLTTFHSALNSSVAAQIAQRVANDLQQTDFSTLISTTSGNIGGGTAPYIYQWPNPSGTLAPIRYFDDQANEQFSPFNQAKPQPIYQVQTRVTTQTAMPYTTTVSPNTNLATATIQVAVNPGNSPLPSDTTATDTAYLLWLASPSVFTSSAVISNNGG